MFVVDLCSVVTLADWTHVYSLYCNIADCTIHVAGLSSGPVSTCRASSPGLSFKEHDIKYTI